MCNEKLRDVRHSRKNRIDVELSSLKHLFTNSSQNMAILSVINGVQWIMTVNEDTKKIYLG